jgi:hypothetical protein
MGEKEITLLEGNVILTIPRCLARIDELDQWLLAAKGLLQG